MNDHSSYVNSQTCANNCTIGIDASSIEYYAKPHESDDWGPVARAKCASNDGTMVTVVCITYNHEDFIAEALDSIVSQRTDFKYKVFVGDDCSTDGTAKIVEQYAERYPDLIVPFFRKENMGGLGKRNLIDLCSCAESPFIAFCEGDDFWIDEYKLQKQFDFMKENPDYRACFARTLVSAPSHWHLRSWYKETEEGRIVLPDSHPLFIEQDDYSPSYVVTRHDGHTSSHFYRWNYDMEIPEWYYNGKIGDTPLLLLQLGNSNLKILHDVVSCYRVNEKSVFYNEDQETHFLETRLDYIDYLGGFRNYALRHFKGYPIVPVENRIKLEAYNYLSTALKISDHQLVSDFFQSYPNEAAICLNAYLTFYADSRLLTSALGWEKYKMMVRTKEGRSVISSVSKIVQKAAKTKEGLNRRAGVVGYWTHGASQIKKGLWVFSGFWGKTYGDNTKYLFEYVCEHCPDIVAVWLTKDNVIAQDLAYRGLPVVMMESRLGKSLMRSAEVAVIDHYVVSDFGRPRPLNKGTKVLQLWHGVGLKSMRNLSLANMRGVEYVDQHDDAPNDSLVDRLVKKRVRFTALAKSEQCEDYFMMVVPGSEMQDAYEEGFHLPSEKFFRCGYPRMDALLQRRASMQDADDHDKAILYAPTFRYSEDEESMVVNGLLERASAMNRWLEEVGARLVVRLHPHTWRSYGGRIIHAIKDADRIIVDEGSDIYESLDEYDVLVTDYSSIAYDYLLLDRPIVFLSPDLEWYLEHESELRYDYSTYTPGPKVDTWEEVQDAVSAYFADPTLDSEERARVKAFFYDEIALDGRACERIIGEMRRRLAIGD